ncbi:MAG: hypothetical protein JJV97_05235 [SAR324 cluster bacterium]|nr:hypothetical protein [SAR324 cluster bacterium]
MPSLAFKWWLIGFWGLFFLAISAIRAEVSAEKMLHIKDINSALTRSLVVAALEEEGYYIGKTLIKTEAKGELVYLWDDQVSPEGLVKALNQGGALDFYLDGGSLMGTKVRIGINHNLFDPYHKQVLLSRANQDNDRRGGVYREQENNDTPYVANIFKTKNVLVGVMEGRGDVDFFLATARKPIGTWKVEVIREDKTSFSPVLVVYNSDISKVGEFDISGRKSKIDIILSFPEKRLYFQIMDKVGAMKFETGKIQPYHYLIKVLN